MGNGIMAPTPQAIAHQFLPGNPFVGFSPQYFQQHQQARNIMAIHRGK